MLPHWWTFEEQWGLKPTHSDFHECLFAVPAKSWSWLTGLRLQYHAVHRFHPMSLTPQWEHSVGRKWRGGGGRMRQIWDALSYRGAVWEGFGARWVAVSDRGWPFLRKTPSWKNQQVLISAPSNSDRKINALPHLINGLGCLSQPPINWWTVLIPTWKIACQNIKE